MHAFDLASILIGAAAATAYINRRWLGLPAMSGTLVVALASAVLVMVVDRVVPEWHLRDGAIALLVNVDFNTVVLRGMLGFLLFAGALHLDFAALAANKWTVAVLATVGVVISTVAIGALAWVGFRLAGTDMPWAVCLIFGALISPTDPIAVLGLLKELRAPAQLHAVIAGESLFNDGVGVVVFFALVSAAALDGSGTPAASLDLSRLAAYFAREVAGGAALGLTTGYLGYRAIRTIDDPPLELLITLALVMVTYAVASWIHVSGPIGVVVAGIVFGHLGRKFAMSEHSRQNIEAFWGLLDEVLNAVLFLLIGWQVLAIAPGVNAVLVGALAIPIALAGRALGVALPVAVLGLLGTPVRGLLPILTWSGLRGGLSVAMALSLPAFPGQLVLLTATFAVVVFSILVQGLTMRPLLRRYRIGV